MRLQCFRLQKTQLGRKLLRICYSNLSCTPSTSSLDSQQWLWKICKLGIGWSRYLSPIMMHSLKAGSKQCVGRAEFCCPRMRGGVRVIPARGRGRIWLAKKAPRKFWQATAFFAGTKEWGSDCCFQEDLTHHPKADRDTRCSGFLQRLCFLDTLASRQQDCGQIVWCRR